MVLNEKVEESGACMEALIKEEFLKGVVAKEAKFLGIDTSQLSPDEVENELKEYYDSMIKNNCRGMEY